MVDSSTTALSATRITDLMREELKRRRAGDRLPSNRHLVEQFKVSPVTVSTAMATLIAEGLVVTRPGSGSFVADPPVAPAPIDDSWQTVNLQGRPIDISALDAISGEIAESDISLTPGYLHPSLMPTKALGAALARAARLPGAWERPPAEGIRGLRTWFAQITDPSVDPSDVLITPGGQGGISTVLHAVLQAGDSLLVEAPTYPGAIAAARTAGIRVVPVPTDRYGVIPELLAESFARTGARAFYCQPRYQNPIGALLDPERRRAILEVAAAVGAFVIEDDFARFLGHGGPEHAPLLADDTDGRVIYITSLSKPVSPSLRIGAIIARGPVAARLRPMRVVDDMFVSRPLQEATLDLVSRPSWPRYLRTLSDTLSSRRDALLRAVGEHLPAVHFRAVPRGGLHLWAHLPTGSHEATVVAAAARHGVAVSAGAAFFPTESPHPHLRLTFSAAPSEAHLTLAASRLALAAPELVG